MNYHNLKTWPVYFQAVWDGVKTAEIRKDDRGFAVGDSLLLEEWEAGVYTGRRLSATISHIVKGAPFLPDDTAVLSLTNVLKYGGPAFTCEGCGRRAYVVYSGACAECVRRER